MKKKDVPFSNGSQFDYWVESNCYKCVNYSKGCKYLGEVEMSRFWDAKVSEDTFNVCFSWEKCKGASTWKPNIITPTISSYLIKLGFTRLEEEKSFIHHLGYEVRLNFKKREFTFCYPCGNVRYCKSQTELKNFLDFHLKPHAQN